MSVEDLDATDSRFAHYTHVVDAIDGPAALVDLDGTVLHRNHLFDGSTKSQVRPIGDGTLQLATPEQDDADHLLRMFYSGSDLLFVVYDHKGRIVEANHAWERLLGYPPEALEGLDSWSLVSADDAVTRSAVERELRETGRAEPSWKMRHADGSQHVVQWTLRFDRRVGRCFAIGREASAELRAADELHRRAYTDPLTGLANRVRLVAELDRASVEGAAPAVLFCDLDGFKAVNDSLGHRVGDQLLEMLGRRLDQQARRSNDVVARIGGDEFVVLLPTAPLETAVERATSMLKEIREPFMIDGRPVHVGMSIGVACADPEEGFAAEELLRQADMAAYEAKRSGRGRFVVFGDQLRAAIDRRFSVEAGLRAALEEDGDETDGAIEVVFQPIVALPARTTVGVEALMRWRDAGGTLFAPSQFADVALEAGLMPAIGDAVRRTALQAIAPLHRAGHPLVIALNASGPELAQPDFAERFETLMERTEVDPSLVVLEVTETAMLIEGGAVADGLARLRRAGIRVALDDYGTGYSLLWHLRRLPIDIVKIDHPFARDLVQDHPTRLAARAILGLCHDLDIEVVIEGVETPAEAAAVEEVGAALAQGFFYDRPMRVSELHHLVGV